MVTGSSSGQVTYQNRFHGLAPSIAAASFNSGLIVCRPASKEIAKKGTPRQILAKISDSRALSGSPRKLILSVIKPRLRKDQEMIENWLS